MPKKKKTEELVMERPSADKLAEMPRTRINLVVDNVRSLDNVGMIFRLCELARVGHLYLAGYTGYPRKEGDERPEHIILRNDKRITKTAVYAVPHQPWSHVPEPVSFVEKLKREGSKVIVLEQTDSSVMYHKLPVADYRLPVTLILGHERIGVRDELIELADSVVEIPILGMGNSHNVATACGILLYHLLEITGEI